MSASDDAKLDMLTDLNEKYTAKIDVDQNGFLLPHSVIFLDAMQELYEKSKQEDE
jgi:hypothetical protein